MVPLSIRGVQQCVALTPAEDHLRSAAVCGCQFMPLTGAMAHDDQRLPVPGHPGGTSRRGVTRRASPLPSGSGRPSRLSISVGPASASLTSAVLIWAFRVSGTRAGTGGDPARGSTLQLTVRSYGEGRRQQVRLRELIVAWDAAGRPGPDHLRIDASPSGVPSPDGGAITSPDGGAIVHVTPHATFLTSFSRP